MTGRPAPCLDAAFWSRALDLLVQAFTGKEIWLCALDGAIGDGDHGSSMLRGMAEARRREQESPSTDASGLLRTAGEAFMAEVGGVTGVMFGSLFTAMGGKTAGAEGMSSRDLAEAFAAGLEEVMRRGKAAAGDKSMVDALSPAATALSAAARAGRTPAVALAEAAAAAAAGRDSTSAMEARVGRARYQGGRAVGHVDAGAASVALILETLAAAAAHGKGAPGCLPSGSIEASGAR
jgi:phosphoenolpyruvate---glycerone phosphotransferase subunit DhaL